MPSIEALALLVVVALVVTILLVSRRARRAVIHYLLKMPGPCVLVLSLSFSGCSFFQSPAGKVVEGVGLNLAEALCEAFLPRAMPTGASLVCKGAEGAIDAAVAAGVNAPAPDPSPSPFGGGGAQPRERVPRELRIGGKLAAVVPLTAEEQRVAQANLDVRASR